MTDHSEALQSDLRVILRDALGLEPERARGLQPETPLFGAMPELDSMAVAGLLAEIEDRLKIVIEDDEIGSDMLETFGSLTAFVVSKQGL